MATFFCKDFAINTSIVIFAIKTIQSMAKVTKFSESASDSLQISASANEKGILTKSSSISEIELYFRKVLELSKSDNEFPVNLEEVWMLIYGRKEEAVRALLSNAQFMEGVDYQVLRKNAEQKTGRGGHNKVDYILTVPCMEFFNWTI